MNYLQQNVVLSTLQSLFILCIGGVSMAATQIDPSDSNPHFGNKRPLVREAPQLAFADKYQEAAGTNRCSFLDYEFGPPDRRIEFDQVLLDVSTHTPIVITNDFFFDESNLPGERVEALLRANVGRVDKSHGWQIGGGGVLSYGFRTLASRFVIHCGSSFKPPREAFEGERCFGLLFRFDLGKRKPAR